MALCSLENKDARARFGILKGLNGARRGQVSTQTDVAKATQREQPPDRGTHGVSGPPAAGALASVELESSTRKAQAQWHAVDVTGTDPQRVAPSKRNSESPVDPVGTGP